MNAQTQGQLGASRIDIPQSCVCGAAHTELVSCALASRVAPPVTCTVAAGPPAAVACGLLPLLHQSNCRGRPTVVPVLRRLIVVACDKRCEHRCARCGRLRLLLRGSFLRVRAALVALLHTTSRAATAAAHQATGDSRTAGTARDEERRGNCASGESLGSVSWGSNKRPPLTTKI